MTQSHLISAIASRRESIRALGFRRLALFGSAARGELKPGSDLDFLVEFQGEPTFDRYVDLQNLLEDLFQRPIDLVTFASLREPIRLRVEREAIDLPGLSTRRR